MTGGPDHDNAYRETLQLDALGRAARARRQSGLFCDGAACGGEHRLAPLSGMVSHPHCRVADMDRVLAFPGGTVPAEAVTWRFDPSGGPGGQHANRSSTRVEAVLDLTTAGDMVPAARERLIDRFGAALRVVVDDTRSQARNRDIALDRLQARLRDGVAVTKPRKPTRPSGRSRRRRLDKKRQRSETKRGRGRIDRSSFDG